VTVAMIRRIGSVPVAVLVLAVMIVVLVRVPNLAMTVSGASTGDPCQRRLVQLELRRRHTRPQDAVGRYRSIFDGQTAERNAQTVERQAEIEQRPEEHVARGA